MLEFEIDQDRCVQCGECANECPTGVIVMEDFPQLINEDGCYKCQHCLAICPTASVSILGRDPDDSIELKNNMVDPDKLATLIKGRRSVRRYKKQDLDRNLIDELLEVSWHAPTGVNSQSVLFTVVHEGKVMDKLRTEVMDELGILMEEKKSPNDLVGQYLTMATESWQENGQDILFRGAPHLLLASAPRQAPSPSQDTLIALTTFQLMAHARGVGTVWNGMFMMALSVCHGLTKRLGIPEDHEIGYAMAFGKPEVEYHRTVQRGPAMINAVT